MADALVDVLTGVSDPGGRLPITYPRPARGHARVAALPPGRRGAALRRGPAHGLPRLRGRRRDARTSRSATASRTARSSGASPRCPPPRSRAAAPSRSRVPFTNVGDRPATAVVQGYVAPLDPPVQRAPKELRGWHKVALDAGASATATFELTPEAFRRWDDTDARVGRRPRRLRARGRRVGVRRARPGEAHRQLTPRSASSVLDDPRRRRRRQPARSPPRPSPARPARCPTAAPARGPRRRARPRPRAPRPRSRRPRRARRARATRTLRSTCGYFVTHRRELARAADPTRTIASSSRMPVSGPSPVTAWSPEDHVARTARRRARGRAPPSPRARDGRRRASRSP